MTRNSPGDEIAKRELPLRRHRARTTKYNRLVHIFHQIDAVMC